MTDDNKRLRKLSENNCIDLNDKTMFNYKCKTHRFRSPNNKTDALAISDINNIVVQICAEIIENKMK